ncbi:unnamed protein product [Adineta ricciae]|uniref:Prokaryotic-type class I peptide chain release factors domain-containing protein n=1 Tax=Adineta ricciae TaxID=249248 RepID=A0A814BAJ2_ADIRI|nr:unnamed protein product [Adineta ricciae]CAF0926715.1 unnamed protein product [Adineta ricciae]
MTSSTLCFAKSIQRIACLSSRQARGSLRFVSTALPDSWYKRFPPIVEKDIEEKAIKGSGPGGQAINKTQNCCQIKHIPTGIVVSCQQTRFLEKNRLLARRQLQEKLDAYYNGEQGLVAQYKRERSEKREAKRSETKKTLEKKRAFKAQQDNDSNSDHDHSSNS